MIMPWLITDNFKLRTKQRKPNRHRHQSPRMCHFCLACLQLSLPTASNQGRPEAFLFSCLPLSLPKHKWWINRLGFSHLIGLGLFPQLYGCQAELATGRPAIDTGLVSSLVIAQECWKMPSFCLNFIIFNWQSLGTALLLTHGTIIYLMVMVMKTMVVMRMRRTTGIIITNIDWTLAVCQVPREAHWLHN